MAFPNSFPNEGGPSWRERVDVSAGGGHYRGLQLSINLDKPGSLASGGLAGLNTTFTHRQRQGRSPALRARALQFASTAAARISTCSSQADAPPRLIIREKPKRYRRDSPILRIGLPRPQSLSPVGRKGPRPAHGVRKPRRLLEACHRISCDRDGLGEDRVYGDAVCMSLLMHPAGNVLLAMPTERHQESLTSFSKELSTPPQPHMELCSCRHMAAIWIGPVPTGEQLRSNSGPPLVPVTRALFNRRAEALSSLQRHRPVGLHSNGRNFTLSLGRAACLLPYQSQKPRRCFMPCAGWTSCKRGIAYHNRGNVFSKQGEWPAAAVQQQHHGCLSCTQHD